MVDEWIDEYKKDREKAIVELIQFFVQCCGCKGKLSQIMFASQDKVKSIRKLTESFDEESGEYPLIQVHVVSYQVMSSANSTSQNE